ncbi:MAG: MBL fold metallo-hydrolase [Cytophagales bacterium]|nr:MBL fold metallo-hydrolase [Bernardetiaceae bacterium]MDW8210044.1 MBL fold metallo-hydrolase [Cytophagales bacterium]
MAIKIHRFTFNEFQENTYLLSDPQGKTVIIDPGCYHRREKALLQQFIAEHGLEVVLVVNTHCHIDHVLGNYFIQKTYRVALLIPEKEQTMLEAVPQYAHLYGFEGYEPTVPDGFLTENDTLQFGTAQMQIRFVPGHSPGHLVFYSPSEGFCIGGDVLFLNSIGRTDLPGGNHEQLLESIRTQLYTLPPETVVYPGHGPQTTIDYERRTNPFCRL